jgi:hypothetical protein
MKLFNKISSNANRLFNKAKADSPSLYRKFTNTIRKIDNSVGRVGNFLSNTSKDLGLPSVLHENVDKLVGGVHNTRKVLHNNLEKAIHEPLSKIRQDPNSMGGNEAQQDMEFA